MSPTLSEGKAAKREILLFIFILIVISILYGTPRLFSNGLSAEFIKEILVDCCIMAIACLPIWWLHFRKFMRLSMHQRFVLHFLTAPIYYLIWILLYRAYNHWAGLPQMSGLQMLQNSGPNLLFYIQVFSSLHIDLFFREREVQYLRQKELRELVHRSEINALKAQIQPHFLFNTLNSISASVPSSQEHTRVLIARLAGIFRYGLDSTKQELVSLDQELEFIGNYLSLEKERFGNRLSYAIHSMSGISNMLIPPMLLQPLVENAIRHGIEPSITGGTIEVYCTRQEKKILICIQSIGAPCAKTVGEILNGPGLGLSNTIKRLKNQFNETLYLAIQDNKVQVQFALPV